MNESEIYYNARLGLKGDKAPEAYLNLGILYAQGIGTRENHVLASYFFEKALAMGCPEAESYVEQEFDLAQVDIENEVGRIVAGREAVAPGLLRVLKRRLEKERAKHNYGILSKLRRHLHWFYPEYDREKATADILANRDTVDADIYYSLCTMGNMTEAHFDSMEQFLHQLYAPIIENESLRLRAKEIDNTALLGMDEQELVKTLQNLSELYARLCKRHDIPRRELATADLLESLPFIYGRRLTQIRKQAFACLLSIRDIAPVVKDEFLNHLDDDEKLLSICEQPMPQGLRSFLTSYVRLNNNIETIGLNYQELLWAHNRGEREFLADQLNECADRLTEAGIEHHLPLYTPDNLPPIVIGG